MFTHNSSKSLQRERRGIPDLLLELVPDDQQSYNRCNANTMADHTVHVAACQREAIPS